MKTQDFARLLSIAAIPLVSVACSPSPPVTFSSGDSAEIELAETLSVGYLNDMLATGLHGMVATDARVRHSEIDDLRMAHTRFQQTYRGMPVFGGEAIVHLDRHGYLFAITDDLVRTIRMDGSTTPALREAEATRAAIEHYGCEDCLTGPPEVDLQVLRHDHRDYLAYRVQLRREDGTPAMAMPVIFVDARSGQVVWEYDNLQTGTGTSLYNGTVTFNTYFKNGTYYLEDTGRRIGTFDGRNSGGTIYRYTDVNDVWNTASQAPGVDVAYGMTKFIDYMSTVHGRNGIDGSGGPGYYTSVDGTTPLISAIARYGTNWNNARWTGSHTEFGNGDGVLFGPFVSIDAVGHEMMHGVTQYTAGLVYANESGALNESWSDVFGALLEHHVMGPSANNWLIFEQCYTPGVSGDAGRHMDEPHAGPDYGATADDSPDHYNERYIGMWDSGGVHVNSGVANKAFYLLANGGTHHMGGSMTGIGVQPAANIWYRALTAYMTSSTNFSGARTATLNAATALYGANSTEYNAVANAWTLCGVL